MGDDVCQFRRFARIGKHQRHVALHHHAQIAVARLGRMYELRGRAGRCQRRRDLARHMPRLAHARHDHPAFRL